MASAASAMARALDEQAVETVACGPWIPNVCATTEAAVVSDVLHRSIHDAAVDQRHRRSGLGAKLDLLVEVSGQLVLLELSDRQDGTGLRHAIAREDVDATLHRGLGQRFGQRRTPDHHFQFGKIDILAVGSRQQQL